MSHGFNRSAAFVAVLILAAVSVNAQVFPGEVGATKFSTSEFSLIDPVAGTERLFDIGTYGGGTSQHILWDPNYSNSFLVGGTGFIGRVVIQGPNAARWESISTATGQIGNMSWDITGTAVVYSNTTNDTMESLDIASGTITPLAGGASPWGASLNASGVSPLSGDVYAGVNNAIWRIPFGGGAPVNFTNSWAAGTSFVSAITFDTTSTDVIATLLSVNRVVRIDAAGNLTDIVAAGTITAPNSCSVAANGDIYVGGAGGGFWTISGGTATNVLSVTGSGGSVSGLSVANAGFRVTSVASAGGGTLSTDDIPVGTFEGWTLLSGTLSPGIGEGPIFGLTPDMLTLDIIGLFPTPNPGGPFHWTYSLPAPAFYPGAPFVIPAGTFAPGTSLDIVSVAITTTGVIVSPITRETW